MVTQSQQRLKQQSVDMPLPENISADLEAGRHAPTYHVGSGHSYLGDSIPPKQKTSATQTGFRVYESLSPTDIMFYTGRTKPVFESLLYVAREEVKMKFQMSLLLNVKYCVTVLMLLCKTYCVKATVLMSP